MAVRGWVWLGLVTTLGAGCAPAQDSPAVSSESETCVSCHELANPGLVADWRASRHARRSVAQALAEPALARRVSAEQVPAAMAGVVVCCLECHGQDPDSHADSFEHFGYRIHTVVTPRDCATCHPQEVEQYGRSKKAAARANLLENPVYHGLVEATTRRQSFVNGTLTPGESTLEAAAETAIKIQERGGCSAIYHAISEADVEQIMRSPYTMVASDGGIPVFGKEVPHPRSYGTFARVLGRYSRDRRVIRLEEAVRKMSSFPAARLKIMDRGLLRPGMLADVVVFDAAAVRDRAEFLHPHQYAEGFSHVIVNGKPVLLDGKLTGELPGRILYGPAWRSHGSDGGQ